jgi:hypothetical protein
MYSENFETFAIFVTVKIFKLKWNSLAEEELSTNNCSYAIILPKENSIAFCLVASMMKQAL